MRKCQQEIEQSHCTSLLYSKGYHIRITVKGCNQHRGGKINDDSYALCHNKTADNTEAGAFFCSVILFGPKILADKGSQRHRKAGDRKKTKPFYFGIGAASGYCQFAKAVDIRLDNHICQRNNGILNACRQSVGNDLAEHNRVQLDLSQRHPVFLRTFPCQAVQAEEGTDKLGNDRGSCGRSYTHV